MARKSNSVKVKPGEESFDLRSWYFSLDIHHFNNWLDWYAYYTGDQVVAERIRENLTTMQRRVKEVAKGNTDGESGPGGGTDRGREGESPEAGNS